MASRKCPMQFRRAASRRALGGTARGQETFRIAGWRIQWEKRTTKIWARETHQDGQGCRWHGFRTDGYQVDGRRDCQQLVTNKAVVCLAGAGIGGCDETRTDTNEGRGWTNCLPLGLWVGVLARRVLRRRRRLPERLRAALGTRRRPLSGSRSSHAAPKANLIFC